MKLTTKTIFVVLTLGSLFSATGLKAVPVPGRDDEEDLAIVVNKSNPIDNLSFGELRRVFFAEESHWSNSRKITVVMREPGHPEREAVLRVIYRMNESGFNRYFLHAQYTGEIQSMPKLLATAAGIRKFVFNVPGAIGYLRVSEVDGSVKVVKVDGHRPGESGYPLKVRRQ